MFGGGKSDLYDYYMSSTVDAYSASLVRSTPTELSVARNNPATTTVGNYGLFGGGYGGGFRNTVDAYDATLVHSTPTPLSKGASGFAATTVGNYGLFGGGRNDEGYISRVDAYTVD